MATQEWFDSDPEWQSGKGSNNAVVGDAQDQGDVNDLLASLRSQMAGIDTNYKEKASRGICATCKASITDEMLEARSRAYHPNHFACTDCSKLLGTDYFYYKDKASQYCEPCYLSNHCKQCSKCNSPITGRYCRVSDDTYVCEACFA